MLKNITLYIYGILLLLSLFLIRNVEYNMLFWIVATLILLIKNGYQKDNNLLKPYTIRLVIIVLLSFFVIVNILGVFLGFNKNIFNSSFLGIIKNIYPIFIVILSQELIRYSYAKKTYGNDIKPYIFLTIILLVIDIATEFDKSILNGIEGMFYFTSLIVVPKTLLHSLNAYITYKVSYVPSLMVRFALNSYIYIFPIIPNLGNYLNSIKGILIPFIIFKLVNDYIIRYNKDDRYITKIKSKYLYSPIIVILFLIIMLVSGVGKYQLIAIGSGSMEPVIYRGDSVLIEKNYVISDYKIGDVLAFKHGDIIVTHRIVGIEKKNGHYYFKTKGDNNDNVDNYVIKEEKVQGRVLYNIKYIGIPTVWIKEIFNK